MAVARPSGRAHVREPLLTRGLVPRKPRIKKPARNQSTPVQQFLIWVR